MIFFEPEKRDKTLLPHNPFTAMMVPRPIGWISTMSKAGAVNIAPYSYFNGVSGSVGKPAVMFSSDGRKDSITYAQETGEFVWNMATAELAQAMNQTSAELPRGQNEFEFAGLETAPCQIVRAPRVAASPIAFECKVIKIVELNDIDGEPMRNIVCFGQVIGMHVDERFIRDGRIDTIAMKPLARLGYMDYAVIDDSFVMPRPKLPA